MKLQPDIQQNIPPFRDSYQTSTFFACILALGGIEIKTGKTDENGEDIKVQLNDSCNLGEYLKPRIFEVGRSGAYDITPKKLLTPIHPELRDGRPGFWLMIYILAAGGVLVVLTMPLSPGLMRLIMESKNEGDTIRDRNRQALKVFWIFLVVFALLFWLITYIDSWKGEGEPFQLFEGISIWPSEFFRATMVLLSWVFVSIAVSRLKQCDRKLGKELLGNRREYSESSENSEASWMVKGWLQVRRQLREQSQRPNTKSFFVKVWRFVSFEVRCLYRFQKEISVTNWDYKLSKSTVPPGAEVYAKYRQLGKIRFRVCRILPLIGLYLVFYFLLQMIFEGRAVPYRGAIAQVVDSVMWNLASGSVVALAFFVVDGARLCDVFTRSLADRPSSWDESPFLKDIRMERGIPKKNFLDLSEWIDMRVIAHRTEVVGGMVTMPFFVLFIGFISINGYFDYWRLSLVECVFFGVILAYAILCALLLRWSAERARAKSLVRMQVKLSNAQKSEAKDKSTRIEQLEILIEEIKSIRRGAFSSWSRHPVVRAILIPFGGLGTVYLLEFLSRMGI